MSPRSPSWLGVALLAALAGCGGAVGEPAGADPSGGGGDDAAAPVDANAPGDEPAGDAAVLDRLEDSAPPGTFVGSVVSFTPGPGAGFGQGKMPAIVLGAPVGGGKCQGSLDVVALGDGGEIVLGFAPRSIVDGPGVDFIVFENAFVAGCVDDPSQVFAEPAEVSVSADGATWTAFPCTATSYPYGSCAGWHPVYSTPANGISPFDPGAAGGDPFDLAEVGVTSAAFVRIRDMRSQHGGPPSSGFDLDAIAIVNSGL